MCSLFWWRQCWRWTWRQFSDSASDRNSSWNRLKYNSPQSLHFGHFLSHLFYLGLKIDLVVPSSFCAFNFFKSLKSRSSVHCHSCYTCIQCWFRQICCDTGCSCLPEVEEEALSIGAPTVQVVGLCRVNQVNQSGKRGRIFLSRPGHMCTLHKSL